MKKLLLILLTSGLGYIGTSAQVLADPSLEASGDGGTDWASTSTNFGTVLCDGASCGTCGGPCVPRTGAWYAWFGGTTNPETGTITQSFTTSSSGGGPLTYWWKVPMKGSAGDTLTVTLDGNVIQKVGTTDSIGAYEEVSVYIGSLAAGSHTLTFSHTKLQGATVSNVLVDDIQMFIYDNASTEEVDFTNGVQVFTDHAAERIIVSYNLNTVENLKLMVTDMSGKILHNQRYLQQQANQVVLSTETLPAGIYNIRLMSDSGYSVTKKVFVN